MRDGRDEREQYAGGYGRGGGGRARADGRRADEHRARGGEQRQQADARERRRQERQRSPIRKRHEARGPLEVDGRDRERGRRRILVVLVLRRQPSRRVVVLGEADVLGGVRAGGRPERERAPPAHDRDQGDQQPQRDDVRGHPLHGRDATLRACGSSSQEAAGSSAPTWSSGCRSAARSRSSRVGATTT